MTSTGSAIGIGADEWGIPLKDHIGDLLRGRGYPVLDYSGFPVRDYPDVASDAAEAICRGECTRAILFCGTGLGMAIVANKFYGVRAVTAHDTLSAERARTSNDAQILTMGAMVIAPSAAETVVDRWLAAEFGGGRSLRKVERVNQIDARNRLPPSRAARR
ncbi:RpiB/LacA/LacB family sugar-phosphate isomerase [Amycolatopsis vancoresmycina]|uniref:RpiB/LacA/LacB family sugar-phosphate isomerase n=1 Tax=Amycolatopsis vancoresmycina TaxID=208444 RepID=UPI00039BBA07|nr:RpiB/LacA/LacB family sugar-phosphate isomerase [Amycolatopsis vancoresmycina]